MYRRNTQGWLKHLDFILWDVTALQFAYMAAYGIRNRWGLPYLVSNYRILAVVLGIVGIMILIMFNTMHNVLKRGYYQELVQTSKQVMLVLLTMTLYMFSVQTGDSYSRITIYLTTFFYAIFGYVTRILWKQVLKKRGSKKKVSIILVADESETEQILQHINPLDNFKIAGIVYSNRDGRGETVSNIPVVADLSTAANYICREWVDEVFIYPTILEASYNGQNPLAEGIIFDNYEDFIHKDYEALPGKETSVSAGTIGSLIEQCQEMAIPVHIRLPITTLGGKNFVEKSAGYTYITSTANYASALQMLLKRMLDILGGLLGSLAALLIIAIVGPMIKRKSPGPILFKQERIGYNGKHFQMLKLRSMYLDAEERKAELMKQNRVSDGMMFKLDFDPRIIGNEILPDGTRQTGLGEFIRRTSLDEFPQFFNVLKGDMSLVGTRPPTVDEWEKYEYHHRARLGTKPGITGMWQVSGRSKITDFEEVVKLDTAYINSWSIGLDLRILVKTVKSVLRHDGAM